MLDSVTHLKPEHRGRAGYCASHGGRYAGYYAARMGIGAVILNDAGIGREQAGIAGIRLLQSLGVPAAAIAHTSARIGDGPDGEQRGILSFVNERAAALGLAPGMACRAALLKLSASPLSPSPSPEELAEARFDIALKGGTGVGVGVSVIGMDSVSLVRPEDAGQIVVTASHGAMLRSKPGQAVSTPVFAAVFNDAGFGADGAGISRLPALDERGIAGACVSCFSARIGDGRSTYEDGFVSALNATARRYGGEIGQPSKELVDRFAEAHGKERQG